MTTKTTASALCGAILISVAGAGCAQRPVTPPSQTAAVPGQAPGPARQAAGAAPAKGATMPDRVVKTDDEWRKILTPQQFHVLREKGTERAFTGAYHASHDRTTYVCAACGRELFSSDAKFDSGTGWPSFTAPVAPASVETEPDRAFGTERTEVRCSRCGGHLGHVFDDGPAPTGLRYCINSAALKAVPR